MHLTDHKTVGLQYAATAMRFLLVGFLLMLLIRWQLAWPMLPLPPALAAVLGESNAPSGYMLPEFYNQLVAMHGTVMIFLAVVPLLTGAFANYLVPLQIGASDMAFPRLNAASYWIFLVSGLLMLASFFVTGGAANSGWTSYPPLAVLATRGQDFWLVGIFLLGVSAMLNALDVITTVIPGARNWMRWSLPAMRSCSRRQPCRHGSGVQRSPLPIPRRSISASSRSSLHGTFTIPVLTESSGPPPQRSSTPPIRLESIVRTRTRATTSGCSTCSTSRSGGRSSST